MPFIADLHLHSKYSRATSRDMDVAGIARWAALKGIGLVGTGDFTHPVWVRELKASLREGPPGLYLHGDQAFMLTTEVSLIYPKNGRLRKIHVVLHAPSFTVVDRINSVLGRFGNLMADGRPTLTLPADTLTEYLLEVSPDVIVIPAHMWTPHFSLFGSNSGFDTIEECFGDQSGRIFAGETGLSSDPPMNWRLSQLDRITLVSNGDAHSPAKLGREATVFDCALEYGAIHEALRLVCEETLPRRFERHLVCSRALQRGIVISAYTEEMFSTGHDAANRAVFAQFAPEDARLVGIGLRAERKLVDKVTKGARMHP